MPSREQPKPATTTPVHTTTPASVTPAPPVAPASNQPQSLASALGEAARSTITSAILDKRPYLKFAFANPYNVSLFAGALVAAGLTLNSLIAITAVGLEALSVLCALVCKRLRHLLWISRVLEARYALF